MIAGAGQTNWASHNLDLYNQRFSELDQIDLDSVGQLQRRWSYEATPGLNVGQTTPLVVDGVMYFHAGGTVLAINAVTGAEIWKLEIPGSAGSAVSHSSSASDSTNRTRSTCREMDCFW